MELDEKTNERLEKFIGFYKGELVKTRSKKVKKLHATMHKNRFVDLRKPLSDKRRHQYNDLLKQINFDRSALSEQDRLRMVWSALLRLINK